MSDKYIAHKDCGIHATYEQNPCPHCKHERQQQEILCLRGEVELYKAVYDAAHKIVKGEQWSQVPLKEAVDALQEES